MRWLKEFPSILLNIWRWLRTTPRVTEFAIFGAVAVVFVCQALGYHLKYMPFMPASGADIPLGWVDPPDWMLFCDYLIPYLRLCLLLGSIIWFIHLIRTLPNLGRLVWPSAVICGLLTLKLLLNEIYEQWHQEHYSYFGEPRVASAYMGNLVMLIVIFLSPPLLLWWYSRRSILEKYTLKGFVQPLAFCFIGFSSLWVIMDLIDALKDYQEAGTSTVAILGAYLKLLPFIYVSVAPASLLLACLYSLTRMSRSNEIIAMLTSGRSLGQILRPLYVVAAYASLIGMAANYHWAPRGEGERASLLRNKAEKKDRRATIATSVMHYDEQSRRTWFVATVPFDPLGDKLRGVEVRQLDEKGRMLYGWYADSARWWPDAKMWSFYNGLEVTYSKGAAKVLQDFPESLSSSSAKASRLDINDWPETPWSIVSSSLVPDNLGVPELMTSLQPNNGVPREHRAGFRLQLFQRFAVPWQCLFIVLTTAPLGVAYSRRGSVGGIAIAVFCFFGLLFMDNMFSSLAKGDHLPIWLAVWMPHLILGTIATVLFVQKSQNRSLASISPGEILSWLKDLPKTFSRT